MQIFLMGLMNHRWGSENSRWGSAPIACMDATAVLLSNTCSIELIGNKDFTKQITDLNNDVLYIILHRLELNHLINTAEAIPQLSDIVGEMFRRKYSYLHKLENLTLL